MPWQLEIHHVDVIGNGDATLIIARRVPAVAGAVNIRSVLIDGGLLTTAAHLHAYLGAQLGAAPLNAIICTHYDNDHVNGLSYLLKQAGRYNNTIIYDQGWPGDAGQEANYIRYLNAINGRGTNGAIAALAGILGRTRVTSGVMADGAPPIALPAVGGPLAGPAIPAGGLLAINQVPWWLLTAAAPDPLWHGLPAGVAVPAGVPTMRFIAANGYVRTPGGVGGPFIGLGVDPKNEKSLAVEVRFGSFRYYAAGDLETGQENQVQALLNPAPPTALGRVLAMKTSHHGSATATSRPFVDQIRPSAAFLSCGTANRYAHPDQQTINVLDGYPALALRHAFAPPLAPSRPVKYYLTGYQVAGPPTATFGGDTSLTAGDPTVMPWIRGHIRVLVTAAQSVAPVQGQLYFAVQAAVQAALTAPVLAGVMLAAAAAPIANAAAEAAMFTGIGPVAAGIINAAGGPAAAQAAAGNAGANAPNFPGIGTAAMAHGVTMAALGAAVPALAAHAAAAGAAAGAIYGGGTNAVVQSAVANAVFAAAGAITWPAALAYGAGAAAPLAPQEQFTVNLYSLELGAPGWYNVTHR